MRELSPDRPGQDGKSLTPWTPAIISWKWISPISPTTKRSGTTTKAWDVGDFNFKAGLLNTVDVQLVYDNYLNVQTKDSLGNAATQSGFGDFTTRLKINLWGDDGGKTAFALLPLRQISDEHGQSGKQRRGRRRDFSFGGEFAA